MNERIKSLRKYLNMTQDDFQSKSACQETILRKLR